MNKKLGLAMVGLAGVFLAGCGPDSSVSYFKENQELAAKLTNICGLSHLRADAEYKGYKITKKVCKNAKKAYDPYSVTLYKNSDYDRKNTISNCEKGLEKGRPCENAMKAAVELSKETGKPLKNFTHYQGYIIEIAK